MIVNIPIQIEDKPIGCFTKDYICPFSYRGIWEHCSLQYHRYMSNDEEIKIQTNDNEAFANCPIIKALDNGGKK